MSVINLSLPTGESVCNGKHISFAAPCACTGVTGVKIGNTTYSLVNAGGKDYVSNGGSWVSGAYMTVMLDCTNSKAYVVSASSHTHTKSQITDFPTSMPASDVYPWAKASTKPSYSASEVGAASSSHNHDGTYLKAAPVTSVNSKTGAVSLSASDVGAAPAYVYSTDDLTAGSSTLTTGKLYFVYE